MLSLNSTPLVDEYSDIKEVTDEGIKDAIASTFVVEESSLNGESLTDVNECYLYLVKSDLNYRRSQLDTDQSKRYVRKAEEWAAKACELAVKDQFNGIIKYAKSLSLTNSNMDNVEERLFVDLDH